MSENEKDDTISLHQQLLRQAKSRHEDMSTSTGSAPANGAKPLNELDIMNSVAVSG
jgi:hypothetical protein